MPSLLRPFARRLAAVAIPIAAVALLVAQARDTSAPAGATPRAGMTALVEKKALPIEVQVTGVFLAEKKDRVAIEPKAYSGDLIVKSLIAEGASVKKGDLLLEFDPENFKKSIEKGQEEVTDAEVKQTRARAELEQAQIDRDITLAQTTKELEMVRLELEAEQVKVKYALEDKETAQRRSKVSHQDRLVNFEQLKQLYEARELHTATENILVERERRGIEDAEKDLVKSDRELAHWKKYEMNKDLEKKELEVKRKEADLKKAQIKHAADIAEKDAGVKKAERDVTSAKKKLEELQADLASAKATSPREGIVFYGSLADESDMGMMVWSSSDIRQNLRIGGRVRTHETLLTVASMDQLSLDMKVPENDVQHMKEGLPLSIRPDAFPDLRIAGKLTKVSQIASRGGWLSTVRNFKLTGEYTGTYPQVRAGMNAQITVQADSVPDAVQVPVIAVFEQGGAYHCYVEEGGTAVKRTVRIGATNGKQVQIADGVRPGERVYLYDPFRE